MTCRAFAQGRGCGEESVTEEEEEGEGSSKVCGDWSVGRWVGRAEDAAGQRGETQVHYDTER